MGKLLKAVTHSNLSYLTSSYTGIYITGPATGLSIHSGLGIVIVAVVVQASWVASLSCFNYYLDVCSSMAFLKLKPHDIEP